MKIISVPRIKHAQRIRHHQVRRFLNEIRKWLSHADRRINMLRYSGRSAEYVLRKAGLIGQGLETIQRHLEWLKERGFQDESIGRMLKQTGQRLAELIEFRNNQDHL